MRSRGLVAIAAIVAVVAVGGMGFAAITSTATLTANGATGTLHLYWWVPAKTNTLTVNYGTEGLSGYANCSVTTDGPHSGTQTLYTHSSVLVDSSLSGQTGGNTIIFNITNAAPGDGCSLTELDLYNAGSLPADVSASVSGDTGYLAFAFNTLPSTIGPGLTYVAMHPTLTVGSGAAAGATYSVTVTVTGTIGS